MGLILIGGLKHCGKTSLGRILARDLECPFFDLDDLVLEETAGKWKSIRQLYRELGRDEFRRLEVAAVRDFIEWRIPTLGGEPAVLSLGGGTIENTEAMAWLSGRGTAVYLKAEAELLFERIMQGGCPPFLSEDNPKEDFMTLYEKRDALYIQFADMIQEVDDAPQLVNAQRLLVSLEKRHAR